MIATCVLQNHVGGLPAIMIVGALVLPAGAVGMIAASTPEGADAIHAKLQIHD
jgi:hypothetical protein